MVREKKPKIIWYKLKDKIIRDIWTLFEKEEEKEDRKRKKHNEKKIRIEWEISGNLNTKKIITSLKE